MMKTTAVLSLVPATVLAQAGLLDLTDLHNYAAQETPDYITKDNTPDDNPITDLGATLGRVLFYDTRLSANNTISCASCHQQEHAFGDPAVASTGVAGTTGRHSMRLINSRFADEVRFFWDERASSLEEQTSQPIQDHVEMGFSGTQGDPAFTALVQRLSEIETYQVLFTGVFGDPTITENRIQRSLAQFVRSIQSFDSKFDDGRNSAPNNNVPFNNFTQEENLGKQLFMTPPPAGGAGCSVCHQPPEFDMDPRSGNNGVTGSLGGGTDFTNTRSPSLRDLTDANGTLHGGLMHNAIFNTPLAAINHYNTIPAVTPGLDPRLRPGGLPQRLNLTNPEKNALVAFLRTLTGTSVYQDEKWATPFDNEGSLSLIVLPESQMEITTLNGGTEIELTSPGVPNVTYLFKTSDDLNEWDEGSEVTADSSGLLRVLRSTTDQSKYYRFAFDPDR